MKGRRRGGGRERGMKGRRRGGGRERGMKGRREGGGGNGKGVHRHQLLHCLIYYNVQDLWVASVISDISNRKFTTSYSNWCATFLPRQLSPHQAVHTPLPTIQCTSSPFLPHSPFALSLPTHQHNSHPPHPPSAPSTPPPSTPPSHLT